MKFIENIIKGEWPVLKRARVSLFLIVTIALGLGAYGGFKLADYTTHERIETLQRLYDIEKQKSQSTAAIPEGVLAGWGGPPGLCVAQVNATPLLEHHDKFVVAVICGMVDPATDKFEDPRITLSSLFTIRREVIAMKMPYTKEMAEGQEKLTALVRAELEKTRRFPPGMSVQVSKWYEVILLPKGTNPSTIKHLSDVRHQGGKILSQEGYKLASAVSGI